MKTVSNGFSAFCLTPTTETGVDLGALERVVARPVAAGVDSVAVLGSTGGYAYLNRAERSQVLRVAVDHADGIPVIAGVGALRTRDVLQHIEDAQTAGVAAVLLAPMTYQPLGDDEVYSLYQAVDAALSVPLIVYDNPSTTHVDFSDSLHGRISQLPSVAAVKIPAPPDGIQAATERVSTLRKHLRPGVAIGVSGDAAGALGLQAGCEAWYSSLGGVLPEPLLAITRAARSGQHVTATFLSTQLEPIWAILARYGSYRVGAAIAELLGLVVGQQLPHPIQGLPASAVRELEQALLGMRIVEETTR